MIAIDILNLSFVVHAPDPILRDIAVFCHLVCHPTPTMQPDVTISQQGDDLWRLEMPNEPIATFVHGRERVLPLLLKMVSTRAAAESQCTLRAAAITWMGHAALILSARTDMQTAFTAWAIDRGFAFLGNDLIGLNATGETVTGFPAPIGLSPNIVADVATLQAFRNLQTIASDDTIIVRPELEWRPEELIAPCNLVIVPEFLEGSALIIRSAAPGEINDICRAKCARAEQPSVDDLFAMNALMTHAPAVRITYGYSDQLDDIADHLIRYVLESELSRSQFESFIGALRGC